MFFLTTNYRNTLQSKRGVASEMEAVTDGWVTLPESRDSSRPH